MPSRASSARLNRNGSWRKGNSCTRNSKPAEGIRLLRQAFEMDENNSLARAVLANTLVEQAQTLVETDWREAEKLAKEAFTLTPAHPMAKTLRTLILDQKREAYVAECVSQARKLQTSGDLASALSRVEEALSAYPREMRLIQIRDACAARSSGPASAGAASRS